MQGLVGFDVAHDPKISTSLACASCHTLITQSANIDGDYTGTEFVEQATYHEWTNSIYDQDETRQECQACHVPRIEDEVALALITVLLAEEVLLENMNLAVLIFLC